MRIFFSLFLLSVPISFPAFAADTVGRCVYEHRECANQCLELEGEGAQAGCVAKCAGAEAQCVSGVGLKSSEPYLRKKADQLENMIEEFFGDIIPGLPQNRPSQPEETDSTGT